MMIQLYIYKKSDGTFMYEDTGSLTGVLNDISENLDFTIKRYPSDGNTYKWIDNDWLAEGETEVNI